MKRIYKTAYVEERDGQFHLLLDGHAIKTPARNNLVVMAAPLADEICREWQDQDELMRPERMPATRLANTAIDAVVSDRNAVIDEIAAFGGDDLVCYRVGEPEELVLKQKAAWDPLIAWARDGLGAELLITEGVTPLDQSPETRRRLRNKVAELNDFELAGLHTLVTLSGSLIIGLAVVARKITTEEGWRLSRIDEDYQAAKWGEDEEAAAQAKNNHMLFKMAARFVFLSK